VKFATPGTGRERTNPEHLFAACWSACFSLPGRDPEVVKELVEADRQICPYSKATRGNIKVTFTVI